MPCLARQNAALWPRDPRSQRLSNTRSLPPLLIGPRQASPISSPGKRIQAERFRVSTWQTATGSLRRWKVGDDRRRHQHPSVCRSRGLAAALNTGRRHCSPRIATFHDSVGSPPSRSRRSRCPRSEPFDASANFQERAKTSRGLMSLASAAWRAAMYNRRLSAGGIGFALPQGNRERPRLTTSRSDASRA